MQIILALMLAVLAALFAFAAFDAGALERRWRPAVPFVLVACALGAASCAVLTGG